MERFIKYKRITEKFKLEKKSELQNFFDGLVTEGWEIIYYNEKINLHLNTDYPISSEIIVTVVVGKRQNNQI